MHYAGGKEKIAGQLAPAILAQRNGHSTYIEPFVGGGSIFCRVAPHFEKAIAADINEDLILLWKACQQGWEPPDEVSEAQYRQLRVSQEHSPLRAFVGFGLSFGGGWFAGFGPSASKEISAAEYMARQKRGLAAKVPGFKGAQLVHADYRTLRQVSANCLIYCDPPYAGTSGYKSGSRHFDSSELWPQVVAWAAQGATVLVSEYQGPSWAEIVWEGHKRVTLSQSSNSRQVIERLFKVSPGGGS